MTNIKPVISLFFVFLLGMTGFVFGQNPAVYPRIENFDTEPIVYCDDSVLVAPRISIHNLGIDEAGKGMKISIANYIQGQDKLVYDKLNGLSYKWDNAKGSLEISGIGTDQEYQDAVAKVYYKNLSGIRVTGIRSFSISLLDADYLPETGHFYRYISQRGIKWTDARDRATAMDYYGLKGYLATITSAIENDFIWTKIDGVGWIGASDQKEEGKWIWETGPEAGMHFWQGNASGYPVSGRFSYWNYGEPNNVQKSWGADEDYAHVCVDPSSRPKSWNDLSVEGDRDQPNGYYYPQGFIIEFGGMPGDPDLKLSASAAVEVRPSEHPEIDYSRLKTLFCGTKSSQINLVFTNGSPQTELISLDPGVTVTDELTTQPTVTVESFGRYKFQLNTIDQAGCSYTDTIMFEFHNQPNALFNLDETRCSGFNLQLTYQGHTEEESFFTWYYNDNIFASGPEIRDTIVPLGYEVMDRSVGLIVNEQGCMDTLTKPVTVKPTVSFSRLDSSGCSPLPVRFHAEAGSNVQSFSWDFGDGEGSTEQHPVHVYQNGADSVFFPVVTLKALSSEGCENSAVFEGLVSVYPLPRADFNPDPAELLITDPAIVFRNSSQAATSYLWDFGDSSAMNEQFSPEYRYSKLGVYPVTLQAYNDYMCADTMVKNVVVNFDRFFPPNAFSPNAPLDEDRIFRIYGEGVNEQGYHLMIYSRWGEMIFESTSMNDGWDGKMKNASYAPAGVYTWILEYVDFLGEKHTQQGNVTLIF